MHRWNCNNRLTEQPKLRKSYAVSAMLQQSNPRGRWQPLGSRGGCREEGPVKYREMSWLVKHHPTYVRKSTAYSLAILLKEQLIRRRSMQEVLDSHKRLHDHYGRFGSAPLFRQICTGVFAEPTYSCKHQPRIGQDMHTAVYRTDQLVRRPYARKNCHLLSGHILSLRHRDSPETISVAHLQHWRIGLGRCSA